MLRVQCGLRTWVYYLAHFSVDAFLYILLVLPSLIMVFLGYRDVGLENQVSHQWLVLIDALSKLSFLIVLLPAIYLFGFLSRNNANNIYKNLGLFLFFVGHLANMVILSINRYEISSSRACELTLFEITMINPFTFNFFNPMLNHFNCDEFDQRAKLV